MSQRPSYLRLLHSATPVTSGPERSSGASGTASGPKTQRRLRLHVTLGFVLSAVIPGLAQGVRGMALWGAIVFASLVAHELGHALVGLASGSRTTIVLYPLGGATHMDPPLSRGRSIVAHLAGPLVSLTLGLAAAWLRAQLGHPPWLNVVMWVNLGWAALNLLPVPPFDGGHLLGTAFGPARATTALAIAASVAAGVATAGLFLVRSVALAAVFGGIAAYSMVEWARQNREEEESRLGLPVRLKNAELLLAQGRPVEAQVLAAVAVQAARSKKTRRKASELLAWCFLGQDRPERAREALIMAGPLPTLDAHCRAAVEEASGLDQVAIEILERARQREGLQPDGVKRLVDLYARRGRFDLVGRVVHEEVHGLDPADTRRVVDAAVDAAAFGCAAELAGALFDIARAADDGIAMAYALAKGGLKRRAAETLHRVAALSDANLGALAQRRLLELGRDPDLAAAANGCAPRRRADRHT